jgi:hypothetical protein
MTGAGAYDAQTDASIGKSTGAVGAEEVAGIGADVCRGAGGGEGKHSLSDKSQMVCSQAGQQ